MSKVYIWSGGESAGMTVAALLDLGADQEVLRRHWQAFSCRDKTAVTSEKSGLMLRLQCHSGCGA